MSEGLFYAILATSQTKHMATYSKVLIQGGKTPGLRMEVTVPTSHTYACETAKAQYNFEGAQYIWQKSWDDNDSDSSSSSSSGMSMGDVGGTGALIGLAGMAWLFFAFTPWILMLVGGAGGAWASEKLTGQRLEDIEDNDSSDKTAKKAGIILATSLILGGIGFVGGDNLKKGWEEPATASSVEFVREA